MSEGKGTRRRRKNACVCAPVREREKENERRDRWARHQLKTHKQTKEKRPPLKRRNEKKGQMKSKL